MTETNIPDEEPERQLPRRRAGAQVGSDTAPEGDETDSRCRALAVCGNHGILEVLGEDPIGSES